MVLFVLFTQDFDVRRLHGVCAMLEPFNQTLDILIPAELYELRAQDLNQYYSQGLSIYHKMPRFSLQILNKHVLSQALILTDEVSIFDLGDAHAWRLKLDEVNTAQQLISCNYYLFPRYIHD